MNDHSLLITNARMVNEGRITEGDLLVRQGRIERIGGAIDAEAGRTLDAAGRLLLPGMIDDQVHFREPGLTHKGNIASESRAAVAGGITSYMEMPNTSPPTLDAAAVEAKCASAATHSLANYAFYLGGSNDNLDAIRRIDPRAVAGVKVFMGASTGNMLVDDPETLRGIFAEAPCLVATHCEDTPTIVANQREAEDRLGEDVGIEEHPRIRSVEACYRSSSLAVELAREHGTRLHVLHLTTARELELFDTGPVEDKQITVEACVHHLFFDEGDYAERGNLIKCNPAIKSAEDRQALLKAVAEGRIDVVATDHAPHTWDEKQASYLRAPAGLPLVQDALPSLFTHVAAGRLSLERLVECVAHSPARRFDVRERGFLREGYWADLVLVDPDDPYTVRREAVLSRVGWSPFEGLEFPARIWATVVSGHLAWLDGRLDESRTGQRLQFDR